MSATYELLRPMAFYGGLLYEPGTLVTDLEAPFVPVFKAWWFGSFRESIYAGMIPVQHGTHWFMCRSEDLVQVPSAIDFQI